MFLSKKTVNKGITLLICIGLLTAIAQFYSVDTAVAGQIEKTELSIKTVADDIEVGQLKEKKTAFVSNKKSSELYIPKNPQKAIELKTGNEHLAVNLPNKNTLTKSKEIDDTVVYSSKNNTSVEYAVQGINYEEGTGVRGLVIIKDNSAPKEYSFDFGLKEGQEIVSAEKYSNKEEAQDGCFYIVDNKKMVTDADTGKTVPESLFCIAPAWAKDRNGKSIPTHYEIKGNKLIQVVDFDENTAFPVVADPAMSGYYYKKAKVKYSNKWSKVKRCSDNMRARKGQTGTLTCNKSVSFSGSISGNIKGITTISVGATYSSITGYSISFKGPATCYMGYKAYYKIEKGIRKKYNMNTMKCVSSNKYTVRKALHGQYQTVKVK